MNTSRAANYYFKTLDNKNKNRVFSTGCIGVDDQAKQILEQLDQDGVTYDIY